MLKVALQDGPPEIEKRSFMFPSSNCLREGATGKSVTLLFLRPKTEPFVSPNAWATDKSVGPYTEILF
jgi:hypothetical protein